MLNLLLNQIDHYCSTNTFLNPKKHIFCINYSIKYCLIQKSFKFYIIKQSVAISDIPLYYKIVNQKFQNAYYKSIIQKQKALINQYEALTH